MESLKDLQTIQVVTNTHIGIACSLSYNYNYIPIYPKDLVKLINRDWWTVAEILTDVVKVGKYNYEERRAVGFILLNEFNLHRSKNSKSLEVNDPTSDIDVAVFAMDYDYDIDVVVKWADYRIVKAAEDLKRARSIYWAVDERNTPLLLKLSDLGWKSNEYDPGSEKVIMIK